MYYYVGNKSHTRQQDNDLCHPKIGGRVARLVATVVHVRENGVNVDKIFLFAIFLVVFTFS
jgi:hypothetical protein